MLAMLVTHLIQSPCDIGIVSISIPFLKTGKVRPREDDAAAAGLAASKWLGWVGSEARDPPPSPRLYLEKKQFRPGVGEREDRGRRVCV